MNWKLNLLIGIGAVTLIASVFGALEQITKFLKLVASPMCKWRWKREGTWPLKVTIKSAQLGETTYPNMTLRVLIEPRKLVILGECKLVLLAENLLLSPRNPLGFGEEFQAWERGKTLNMPITYTLSFNGIKGEPFMIQIEAEGYYCKSNQIVIS